MSLSTTSIKRPVLAIVMNLVLVLFGIIGYTYLGVREFPSIDPPIISVRTNYAGANPDIIQSQITEPLERSINQIDGIRNMTSSSSQGSSRINIEFVLSKDLEEAANDVRDKVSQAMRSLPQDIDAPPVVSKADADSEPIIVMTVQSASRSALDINDIADNVIAQRIQTLPGVSSIQIWGQKRYAMRLWIDPMRLAAYGITPLDVRNALNRQNVELPSGKITGSSTELTIKTIGNLTTEEDFNNLIIRSEGDRIVRFRDVGEAVLSAENLETDISESGRPMVAMAVIPQPGTNYIDIADAFYERLEQLRNELPSDIVLDVSLDNTLFIKQSVTEVAETILIALVLVVLIIYLFFRNWGIAFRPLIDIPVSLIATFFIMYLCGFSINVLTLLAIVLATGLVVDDGIVVTENIYKKVEAGMNPFEAAIKGSNEIFFAVISISITLAAVFLPVMFMEGFVGRLFREFGVVIASAVLISAFVALSLTPMLNAYLMRKGGPKHSRFYNWTEPYFVTMTTGYANTLRRFMHAKWLSFPILAICFGLIAWFWVHLKKETAPYEDRSRVNVSVTGPEGSSYAYMEHFMGRLTQMVNDSVPEKTVNIINTSPSWGGSGSPNTGRMRIGLVPPNERERSQQDIVNDLSRQARAFTEARTFVSQQPTISVGRRGGMPIQYIIQAPDFASLEERVPAFMDLATADPTFMNVDVDLKFNRPELNISINREKAQTLGVSVLDVAQTLQLSLSGQRFGYFLMSGKQYQVIGQFLEEDRSSPLDLAAVTVRGNDGQLIQLDNLVDMEERSSPPQLFHNNRFMSATVSASLAPGRSIAEGIDAMDRIADQVLDDSFSTDLAGESRDFRESSSNTLFAFGLALLLVYLILAAQFESFKDPLIIILTVPMAVAGAMLSLWITGQSWNVFSQIGTIMLIGLVTKNGILIVEFANQLKRQGRTVAEAIVEASEARLRPILMTSLAIALGALPIAVAFGAAATSRIGMGVVIVGGTLFSLILTLYVIPAVYAMWSREYRENENLAAIEAVEKTQSQAKAPLLGGLVLFLAFLPMMGHTQTKKEVLRLDEAIATALETNYQIRLVANDRAIAENNVSLGNAGMLPRISADVSGAAGIQNTTQTLLSGETRDVSGAQNQSLAYGANLQWTLFDGFQMFTRYEQLKELHKRGEALWKAEVLNTVYAVFDLYYELIRQKQLIHATETALQLSQLRLQTAEHRYQIGRAAKLEVLSAQVDLNADTTALLRQKDVFENTRIYLNELIGWEIDRHYEVEGDMNLAQFLDVDELVRAARALNPDIQVAALDVRLAELESRRIRSQRYPVIDLSAAFTRSRSHAELGFSTESRGTGLNAGISASIPIFNGLIQRKNERNAAIEVASAGLRLEEVRRRVEAQLNTAYRTYLTQLELVRLEEANVRLAQENLDITLEKFNLGSIAPLEFREAQRSFVDASTRHSTAMLQCKMAETTLKQIAGMLVLD